MEELFVMKIIVCENYEEMSKAGAEIIAETVKSNPSCVLGLATGSTPVGMYKCLAEKNKAGEITFKDVKSYNLDEYYPLAPDHDQSYRYFMNENLFNKINISIENTYVPNGCATDLVKEGQEYDELISRLGGIDLQLLGIGLDGHIGFNEPDEFFTAQTHPVCLDESTIEANARFFASKDDVPTMAITMGMKSIMQAKSIVLIANGAKKWDILEKALYGKITPKVPASILQLHPNLTVIYSEN
jgi:glucosamine-6-phosphate deaminase